MKIAVMDLTTHPEPLLSGLPRVGEQVVAWMKRGLPEATYRWYAVAEDGEALPQVEDFDGLVLSGSEFGVYDDVPWMAPLRQLLLDTKAAGKPIYGICFGHQLMADTFGGKAEKVHAPVMGAQRYAFEGRDVDVHVWHKDQVTEVPPGATVTGAASYCPVGALAYDFPAASVQFHPEYSERQLRALYDRFTGIGEVDPDDRDKALASFEGAAVSPDLAAAEMGDFFRQHLAQSASLA